MSVPSISNSEISTFLSCPRSWYLTYYRGLKPKEEKVVGALPLGSRVHAALETYYTAAMNGQSADLLAAHSTLVEADRLSLSMRGHSSDELDKEADLGRVMLEGYLDWVAEEGIDANLEFTGVEDRLTVPVLDGRANLTGKTDLRAVDTRSGEQKVIDLKTSARFGDLTGTAHLSPQLRTYLILDRLAGGAEGKLQGGTYRMLKKTKRTARATPPFYEEYEVRFSQRNLDVFYTGLLRKIENIMDTRDALDAGADPLSVCFANPTRDCTFRCFAGETEVLTKYGIKRIDELAGSDHLLLVPGVHTTHGTMMPGTSTWAECQVKEYGEQEVVDLVLRRGRQTKTIRVTKDHRWFLTNKKEKTTAELQPGDALHSAKTASRYKDDLKFSSFAAAAGFVYGDGYINNDSGYVNVFDSAPNKTAVLPLFDGMPSSRVLSDHKNGPYTRITGMSRTWKQLPEPSESLGYLMSWLSGYFAADGNVSVAGQATISSASRESLDFVRLVCARAGITCGPVTTSMRKGTKDYETPLHRVSLEVDKLPSWFFLNLRHSEYAAKRLAGRKIKYTLDWKVVSVASSGPIVPVYCAYVPEVHAFALADDLLTSNCDFFSVCGVIDDDAAASEAMLADQFSEQDPYGYYDTDPVVTHLHSRR